MTSWLQSLSDVQLFSSLFKGQNHGDPQHSDPCLLSHHGYQQEKACRIPSNKVTELPHHHHHHHLEVVHGSEREMHHPDVQRLLCQGGEALPPQNIGFLLESDRGCRVSRGKILRLNSFVEFSQTDLVPMCKRSGR